MARKLPWSQPHFTGPKNKRQFPYETGDWNALKSAEKGNVVEAAGIDIRILRHAVGRVWTVAKMAIPPTKPPR
jgi:hypothetical protein